MVLQLREAKSKDTGKGRGHAADEVEDGITLLKLISGIPAAQEICATWEESCLENSENEAERN